MKIATMLDDDWIELATHLEWIAATIRDQVDDDDREEPSTQRLRRMFGDKPTHALITAAEACGVTAHRSRQ